MKYGGHQNPGTYNAFYAPNNSGADGQGTYFTGAPRTIVNELFRGLTLDRHADLWQSLPAEKKYELERSEEFVKIEKELEDLKGTPETTMKERERLYHRTRQLKTAELRKCRASQPRNPLSAPEDANYAMGSLRARFSRVSRMMPERERLARGMFLVTALRSPEGRSVLNDMVALCKQQAEVMFRPGLEAEKCHCANLSSKESKANWYVGHLSVHSSGWRRVPR